MTRRYLHVDVFGATPFGGNPLPVVIDAEGLTTEQMLAITRWMNQSETAFLLPPTDDGADYRVRIFTLAGELPFAGHPTLGSCHAWLATGGEPARGDTIVQECGAGPVELARADGGRLAFAAPPLVRDGPMDQDGLVDACRVLGVERDEVVDAAWVDNGPGWAGVLLADADAVLALRPDRSRSTGGAPRDIGVVGPHAPGHDADVEVRAFFHDAGGRLLEDPVTGSLNASLGQWLFATGRVAGAYVAAQGTVLGRTGRVHVHQDDDGRVWVAGDVTTVVTGTIDA